LVCRRARRRAEELDCTDRANRSASRRWLDFRNWEAMAAVPEPTRYL
jgi:hypothetical protein